ncbi:MAG: Holliday junction branch migration DNA helicase RuvB [Candidatus Pacebacteria bacterium]|nr:Holliday junction branch migration DNA helicase RuvB [Candidatus Paceibacterota bacterium]
MKITDSIELAEDENLDLSLRPKFLKEFIGQDKIKKNIDILIKAAQKRNETIEHILFHGSSGLGKTTLSYLIANEMNKNIRITSGPAIEKVGDLGAILTNMEDGDILFIDEIHRLNKLIEEVLYPAMEDYALDIIVGKGPSARTIRLDLPKFTLIGATTRIDLISSPLLNRFGISQRLDFYNDEDIQQIIKRSGRILDIDINSVGAEKIAKSSRQTPRIANRLLKRVRDFAQVKGDGIINEDIVNQTFNHLEIDNYGLEHADRKILEIIIKKFDGGPVGVSTIAASLGEQEDTVEYVYEPYLLQLGFLQRTPRGRKATKLAYNHLGINYPEDNQNTLL